MKSVHSMVVAIDGEAKCGKTTVIDAIAAEAGYQASIIPELLTNPTSIAARFGHDDRNKLHDLHRQMSFDHIATVSAGNMYRAVAMYVMTQEREGYERTSFSEDDVEHLRGLLSSEGIYDYLQKNAAIGKRVSSVAQMPGVHGLCGAVFSDAVEEAYHKDGSANLVIVDARDPVGHLRRSGRIGTAPDQIEPASIMPIYIDTPAEVAASRLSGEYAERLEEVTSRRHMDATRAELPVKRPGNLISSFSEWWHQFGFPASGSEVAAPLLMDNGEHVSLDHIQHFAGLVAVAAQDAGFYLNNHLQTPAAKLPT